jgi:UDP-N-acetylglucosamine--N-acetylmuramyl-(pentapeptide) pyrophosphoryl-undecaprenol N-acetylglucosamine transferase
MPDFPSSSVPPPSAAIACGGTGGHLFPGLAVAGELRRRGCAVTLLVSRKEVDQQAVRSVTGMEIVQLPAIGWSRGGFFGFAWGFWQSYRLVRRHFRRQPPALVLAMGGFISAPPVLAGKRSRARTFLHESNSIPGRANRWLAPWVDGAFVYFPAAAQRLSARQVEVAGMPVRPEILQPLTAREARAALGLAPESPVLLVMGGSQGARKVNDLILRCVPQLRQAAPDLQFLHLTGPDDFERVRASYQAHHARAKVHGFFHDMGLALAAADVAVSRAGASSLAELAARQLPAVLIPYPTAADDHQYHNARALAQSGAARLLQQDTTTPGQLADEILDLLRDTAKRAAMRRALTGWLRPAAAAEIAERILHWNPEAGDSRAAGLKLKAHNVKELHC